MAYTNIDDPSAYFQALTYTGNSGTGHAITNDGNSDLQPDLLWIKNRTVGYSHALYDSSRGTGKVLRPNGTNTEGTVTNGVTAFGTNGFTVGSAADVNEDNLVAWQWKANAGTTSSNTDGDLTSTVQFNSTAGFSIVTYTGKSPIEPLDVGHGMGEVPDVIIVKNRSSARLWAVYHKELTSPAANRYIQLNTSTYGEQTNSTLWRNEAPTTTVFKTGENAAVNQPSENLVAYCWKERQGFSKFGKYVGNGSTDGTFVYTGFKPAWIMCRRIDGGGNSWDMHDSARDPSNPSGRTFYANTDGAELTGNNVDLLSNGFKQRDTSANRNGSGNTYIYMAFASSPFTTSGGIPTTAR
jgi:hypothetical protein